MAWFRKPLSLGAKSFLVAAWVSLLAVIAWNTPDCLSESTACVLITPAFWVYWAPSLLVAWAFAVVVFWAVRARDKQVVKQ